MTESRSHEATPSRTDHDVVVVGSGFGGSVAALRLAEKDYDVLVLEAGRRFEDDDFPRTSWRLSRYFWVPRLRWYGLQRIHWLNDVLILAGAGVGGGSLGYANTLYVPPRSFFTDRQWSDVTDWSAELAPYYEQATRMLGVVQENPCEGPVEELMRETADAMGVGHTFRKTPVGVFFGRDDGSEPGRTVPDPFFGGIGPPRTGCTECGNCMVGCRVGAKNTVVKNYLALAERLGVRVQPLRTVVDVRPVDPADPGAGWRVTSERTGAWLRKDTQSVTATHVVLAAGTWGTQTLLHRMKRTGVLPLLSDRLGELTRTNSEALVGAMSRSVPPGVDLTHGVAITSSFHPDADTHVENVRYGKGSNAMGNLLTLMADGRPGGLKGGRVQGVLKQLAARPGLIRFLLPAPARRFSERTIIGLVMQPVDNSITVQPMRRRLLPGWRLSSRPGTGAPNPNWIPAGHAAMRNLARRLEARTGVPAIAGGSLTDLFDIPMTAHFLGGCVIGSSPRRGVVDPYDRVWRYPGLHIADGSTISANLGVNPALTITAQAERAFALWPNHGDADPRPGQDEPYRQVAPVPPRRPAVPAGAHGAWRLASRAAQR
ncbi:MAG TPA: GMC family oxidoreductase [Actinomycetes bacterium]|nr:GMC family oxidoreductase [Actinomycetes bacterium]